MPTPTTPTPTPTKTKNTTTQTQQSNKKHQPEEEIKTPSLPHHTFAWTMTIVNNGPCGLLGLFRATNPLLRLLLPRPRAALMASCRGNSNCRRQPPLPFQTRSKYRSVGYSWRFIFIFLKTSTRNNTTTCKTSDPPRHSVQVDVCFVCRALVIEPREVAYLMCIKIARPALAMVTELLSSYSILNKHGRIV